MPLDHGSGSDDSVQPPERSGPHEVPSEPDESPALRRIERVLDRTRRQLRREEATIEAFQRAALPEQLPAVDGMRLDACYQPARVEDRIGGDWYDVLTIDGQAALVVGDVVGHGLASVTVMAEIRNALRAYLIEHRVPEPALTHANRFLASIEGFATCLCIVVDPATGQARASRAGHLPPLIGPTARIRSWEIDGGPMLGATGDATFPTADAELQPGDLLALYTDGLVERRGEHLDVGIGRLRATLADVDDENLDCVAVVDELAPTNQEDDLCLLLARYNGTHRSRGQPNSGTGQVSQASGRT